jgi:hypothetical protein
MSPPQPSPTSGRRTRRGEKRKLNVLSTQSSTNPHADNAQSLATMSNDNEDKSSIVSNNTTTNFRLTGGNWHATTSSSHHHGSAVGDASLAALEREHEEVTKFKKIEKIYIGQWEVEAWYFSPYPTEYSNEECLFICEFCLKYMKKKRTYLKHKASCPCKKPPGVEIYRENNLSVFEIDGKEHRVYCQNLCLLAKLFLDHFISISLQK